MAITYSAPDRGTEAWTAWTAVAAGLTAAAGVSALNGLTCWRALERLGQVRARDVAPGVGAVVFLALVGLVSGVVIEAPGQSIRGASLVGVAILGSFPTLMAMVGIAKLARSGPAPSAPTQVETLLRLGILLRRLLWSLGSLVALSTLALGVSSQLRASTIGVPESQVGVLILGGLGSAIVALAYVPVATSLRNEVRAVGRAMFPMEDTLDGESALSRLRGRAELERLAGGERGIFDELTKGLVILAPVITTAIGTYVTG
ncbi:MAG TPA: hypothetical protein VMS99_02915 [Acidimicrobiia bacterium]|nr:hypothetical protein [Acidimicrobiia bacterium]